MDARASHNIRVGIFVLLGMIVMGALVFIIGDERHMFQGKVVLHTSFHDVGGLRAGSPVRMGGVNVGQVTAVRFSDDRRDPTLHVDFELVHEALVRVRQNSVATIASKGLLGDKALDITIGDPTLPQMQNEATIRGEDSDEIGNALRNATAILSRASTVMDNVIAATQPLANPELGRDVTAMTHNLRIITDDLTTGHGTVARLLSDETMGNQISATLNSAQAAVRDVQGVTSQFSAIAHDARTGNGLVHSLIYDPAGGHAVASMSAAANELAAMTHDIRTGNGGLHTIIYGNDSAQAVANMNQATAGLRDIVTDIQHGRGTIGALLVDPSLYDDLKALVGNVQRNDILRAMVRYSIHANERDAQPATTAHDAADGGHPPAASAPANDNGAAGTGSR